MQRCGAHLLRQAAPGAQLQRLAAAAAAPSSSAAEYWWPGAACCATSSGSAGPVAAPASSRGFAGSSMPPNAMDLIKQLRQTSGAPIADVKACLAASGWDMDAAMEALRLKGLAAAVKKASRHASEGLVAVAQLGHSLAAVVEVNSETDFVARSAPFQQLVGAAAQAALGLAQQACGKQAAVLELDTQQLASARLDGGSTVEEGCAVLAGRVRENIALRRGFLVSAGASGVVGSYVHMPLAPGAGRIAAVVALEAGAPLGEAAAAQLAELGASLAMHSAGMNTQHVSRQRMSPQALAAVRADLASATEAQMPGKPAEVLAKIVDGKLAKWCKDSCLLEQKFVLDDGVTVAQVLKQHAKQLGLPTLDAANLLRVQVGEGLARHEDKPDFAAEVAAMAGAK